MAYAQVRMQAQHALRPDPALWRMLISKQEFAPFLDALRGTVLGTLVERIGVHSNVFDIDEALQDGHRADLEALVEWMPASWAPALRWCTLLPQLQVVQCLLDSETVPPALRSTPGWQQYVNVGRERREELLRQSDYAPLVEGEGTVMSRWHDHWRSLWPRIPRRQQQALARLANLVREHIRQQIFAPETARSWELRNPLHRELERMFRQEVEQPVTAFVYLALRALDRIRLRELLMRRALYAQIGSTPWG